MRRSPGRQPLPDALIAALLRAGVSLPTALAMERYKAVEILELLPPDAAVGSGRERTRRA